MKNLVRTGNLVVWAPTQSLVMSQKSARY